jgi:hypothetical protein
LDLVISQPSLLCREPSSVASTIGALQHLLATSYQTAVAVLLRQPSIVGRSAAVLQQQHALLVQLTGLPAPRLAALLVSHPRLLTYGAANVTSCANLVQEVLGVQGRELGELLEEHPEFLLHTITTLEAVGELQACLGLPMWQVARIVKQNPRVLRGSVSQWGDNMRALTWRLGVTPGRAVALVTALPALLVEPREELAAVAGELGEVAALVPAWRQEVEGGPAAHVSGRVASTVIVWAAQGCKQTEKKGSQSALRLLNAQQSTAEPAATKVSTALFGCRGYFHEEVNCKESRAKELMNIPTCAAVQLAPWLRAKPAVLGRLRWLAGTPHAVNVALGDLTPFNRGSSRSGVHASVSASGNSSTSSRRVQWGDRVKPGTWRYWRELQGCLWRCACSGRACSPGCGSQQQRRLWAPAVMLGCSRTRSRKQVCSRAQGYHLQARH